MLWHYFKLNIDKMLYIVMVYVFENEMVKLHSVIVEYNILWMSNNESNIIVSHIWMYDVSIKLEILWYIYALIIDWVR